MAGRTYDDAVELLNTLQTPYKILKERRDAGIRIDKTANEEMRKCLERIGYSQQDLQNLNVVHVAGTKGKGSTCAYVDSILTQYRGSHDIPRNVGLFTSPHLIAVRERIRINSAPISAALFAKYFFEVWDRLSASSDDGKTAIEKPVYFRYLTLVSYHAFLQEGVDAAIYEVGMGGEYDSTNIVDQPAVTGISTLGIDHTFYLGETVEEIAWHKAGIQKPGVPSFSVNQKAGAMKVVEERADERQVKSLQVIDIDPRLENVKIRPDAPFQRSNASLAVALTDTLLQKKDPKYQLSSDSLPKEFIDGLERVVWRGRCEKIIQGAVTWYLDGAHTADSVIVATKWFRDESIEKPGSRVLIFNQQGHREAIELLENLYEAIVSQNLVKFDHVIFCPTIQGSKGGKKDFVNNAHDQGVIEELTMQKAFAEKWGSLDTDGATNVHVIADVDHAIEYVRDLCSGDGVEQSQVHAFITGSVHLIGTALGSLEDVDAL